MNKITQQAIDELLDYDTGGSAVSIYLPTHRHPTPPYMQEDQTRLKNLLQAAEGELDDSRLAESFEKARQLLDNLDFWRQATESLAVFLSEGEVKTYNLPYELEERLAVSDSFDIAPLLLAESLNRSYYILALAQHNPAVFVGDMYGVQRMEIELPASPEAALNIDEMFAASQTQRRGHAGGAASPHGEGDSSEAGQEERLRFYRLVEEALVKHDDFDVSCPIILAGTDGEIGDFRNHSRLKNITPEHIKGNHTETSPQELYRLASPLLYEYILQPQMEAASQQFHELHGTGRASADIDEIMEAAEQGRVDQLLVNRLDMSRDSVSDAAHGQHLLLRRPEERLSDILELTHQVVRNSGQVIGLEQGEYIESDIPIAAIYRY